MRNELLSILRPVQTKALNQPDVYETNDLPEADQAAVRTEHFESENIDSVSVNSDAAKERFKHGVVVGDGVDFSDQISRLTTGYRTYGNFELVTGGYSEPETVEQKFKRLQIELNELSAQMDSAKKEAAGEASAEQSAVAVGPGDVARLQAQLKDVQIGQIIGSRPAALDTAALDRMMDELQAGRDEVARKDDKSGGGQVTYEIFYDPQQTQAEYTGQLAKLEERLTRMERLLDPSNAKLAALLSDTQHDNLSDAVQHLSNQVHLLDGKNLDLIESRLSAVVQKLNTMAAKESTTNEDTIAKHQSNQVHLLDGKNLDMIESRLSAVVQKLNTMAAKESTTNEDTIAKVTELYELMQKWDSMCASLPQICDRLLSLKDLHQQALQFSQALTQLDAVQQQLEKTLATDQSLLSEIQEGLTANVQVIKANCESVYKRFEELEKR